MSIQPVHFSQVRIKDRFWSPRQAVNRTATVRQCLKQLDLAGNMLAMELAAKGSKEGYKGLLFNDSDLYKTLEGISYVLALHPDPELDAEVDRLIALVASAQMDDGYLNTWVQVTHPNDRFRNLRDWHELYCAGHLVEAAVAHFQATGKRNLLDVALKFVGLLYDKVIDQGEVGYCGHPELELALFRLWRATDDQRWYDLSERMIETRGSHVFAAEHETPEAKYDGTYWLDDVPIRIHREIKGHAVRAAYLLSAAADLASITNDIGMIEMLKAVWRNAVERRIFVTGGIGPSHHNEGFTVDYDLPNRTAYQETCASIAMAMWGHRMALLTGESHYMDAVENALYNAMLGGVSLDGRLFYYVNPLESDGTQLRKEWYQCACCPPNVLRTIASIGGYAYTVSDDSIFVNLFIAGSVKANVGGQEIELEMETDFPRSGDFTLRIVRGGRFTIRLRKPSWCSEFNVTPTRSDIAIKEENGYLTFAGDWVTGDTLTGTLEMTAVQLEAHPNVEANRSRTALRRGPLIYCLESADQDGELQDIVLPPNTQFEVRFDPGLLGGITVLEAEGQRRNSTPWSSELYRIEPIRDAVKLIFIPYGFWSNREPGPMQVWIPTS